MSTSRRSWLAAAFMVVALMGTPGLASGEELTDRGLADNYRPTAVTPVTGRGLADNFEPTAQGPEAATAPRADQAREIRVPVVPQSIKVALGTLAGLLAIALLSVAMMFRQRHASPSA